MSPDSFAEAARRAAADAPLPRRALPAEKHVTTDAEPDGYRFWCPHDGSPGDEVVVKLPGMSQRFAVTIPEGVLPGEEFIVPMPTTAAETEPEPEPEPTIQWDDFPEATVTTWKESPRTLFGENEMQGFREADRRAAIAADRRAAIAADRLAAIAADRLAAIAAEPETGPDQEPGNVPRSLSPLALMSGMRDRLSRIGKQPKDPNSDVNPKLRLAVGDRFPAQESGGTADDDSAVDLSKPPVRWLKPTA